MIIINKYNRKANKIGYLKKNVFIKRIIFSFLFLAIIVSGYYVSKIIRTKGYNGLWDFLKTLSSNYLQGRHANPENISIEIKDKDFKFLEKNRENALERNVIINDIDGDYVPATLEYKGKKIKIKLRLKGHMTDHLQNDKWSFRIKIKDKDSFMGMKRFSIQHPGTRGYIYEWIYHELMKREDVIALRYKFINVSVNGRDWGIYAVEENFENELIENNNRVKGPIIRFNPDLYWVNRYNELRKENSYDEFASYYSANIEAYRESDIVKDSLQKQYFLKAMALVEGLRNRKISVERAFDINRMAKFHAVIDLVGGEHSIDWSDIKYYYNPVTGKLEPVAYESFTNLNTRELSSAYKFVQLDTNENYADWHTMIFSDPAFFKEYIRQLERMTQPAYFDEFFNESNAELSKNLAIIYKEFPYKKFDSQDYYIHQKLIRKILDPPKALHAYLNKIEKNAVYIQLAPIDAFPVEVSSVKISGHVLIPENNIILPEKQSNVALIFHEFKFQGPKNSELLKNIYPKDSITIQYSILGSSIKKQALVFLFPHTDNEFISDDLKNKVGNIKEFSFLSIDEASKSIRIKPGKQIISKDLIIPKGYKVFADSQVSLNIASGAKIISYSPFLFVGTEDFPIVIESMDSTSQGIEIISAPSSKFTYVTFKTLPAIYDKQWARSGALTFYESSVEFSNCNFYNCKAENAVNIIRSKFIFKECLFHKMSGDALNINFSDGGIINCAFEDCKMDALDITMGRVNLKSVYVSGSGNKGLNIKDGTQLSGNNIRIKKSNVAIVAEDLSTIELQNVTINDCEFGIAAYNKAGAGHPSVKITGLVLDHVKKNYLRENKSTVIVNGANINEEVKDVNIIIKGDKREIK